MRVVAVVLLCMVLLVYSYIMCLLCIVFLFKQKTAYEMRISDWSSDVCSSDLRDLRLGEDRNRRYDDLELVIAELLAREEGFVLPGQQHVAETALHEGRRRAACAGIKHRHVLEQRLRERLRFRRIVVVRFQCVGISRQEIPARAA